MTSSSTGAKQQPVLDESSFQQLLAAAYVVQQHQADSRSKGSESGTSQVLATIAEIQSLVRAGNLNVAAAASLIGDRLLALTRASGVSVSLITDGFLDCVAESGTPAKVPGSCVSSHSLVATERLKAGGLFESDNSRTDMRLDIGVCRNAGVGSLVAAPVHRFGEIAGLIEVRWNQPVGYNESDLRTCRLMAGLMTGTLERSLRIQNARAALAHEPPAPAEIADQEARETVSTAPETPAPVPALASSPPQAEAEAERKLETAAPEQPATCRVCGRRFGADETFCGFCSMPRTSASASEGMQSKWASLWFMQRAQGALQQAQVPLKETRADKTPPANTHDREAARAWDLQPARETEAIVVAPSPAETTPLMRVLQARTQPAYSYRSAPAAVEYEAVAAETPFPFTEQAPVSERTAHFARRRWRDAILAVVAMSLAYGLITAWPRSNSQPTWFQSLMARFGVMKASTQPVFAGSPDARVWIDVHTQLYYCEGTDLYGKTPDGEFTTQHNAQSDGFQSASNVTCP